ncbi:hypothetical protein [Psychrobacter sp. KH172YL61]|uniref:hypothetical protein n=1 Tax=Psychrobacter sp. KH172YL61 TaxID=2517899 RepID=UPI001F07FE86|nr:hypothetical protein [Psychrobacter sp. KH172YL61]
MSTIKTTTIDTAADAQNPQDWKHYPVTAANWIDACHEEKKSSVSRTLKLQGVSNTRALACHWHSRATIRVIQRLSLMRMSRTASRSRVLMPLRQSAASTARSTLLLMPRRITLRLCATGALVKAARISLIVRKEDSREVS